MFTERLNPKTEAKVMQQFIPLLLINQQALYKMWTYVDSCSDEIGWLGTIQEKKGFYYLDDVFLFHQEVHATTTEITVDGLTSFAEELLQQENGMELWNTMRVWGHSHVNMAVFASGQDDAQMKTFGEAGNPYFFRIISNKKGELKVDMFHYANGITYLDVPWEIHETVQEEELRVEIESLYKQLDLIRSEGIKVFKEPILLEMKDKVKKLVTKYTYDASKYTYDANKYKYNGGTDTEKKYTPNGAEVKDSTSGIINERDRGTKIPIIILDRADVLDVFDREDLIDLATMKSLTDIQIAIDDLDLPFSFNHKQLNLIWQTAYEVLEEDYTKRGY